jgi:hypothetical protein
MYHSVEPVYLAFLKGLVSLFYHVPATKRDGRWFVVGLEEPRMARKCIQRASNAQRDDDQPRHEHDARSGTVGSYSALVRPCSSSASDDVCIESGVGTRFRIPAQLQMSDEAGLS